MASFTDKAGRKWLVDLTVGDVKRVEAATKVNLGAITQETFAALASDWSVLVDVMCAIIRPQLQEEGVSDEDFAGALGGDELAAATDALLAALVDFSHPKKREALRLAIAKLNAMQDREIARATARIEALTLRGDSGEPSTSAPESSESTPPAGVSEDSLPQPMPDSSTSGIAQPGFPRISPDSVAAV